MIKILSAILIVVIGLTGCATSTSETPEQGIRAIMKLFEARDFDTLVRTRYAEIDKTESEQQVQSLIDRYKTQFQNDETLRMALTAYESALKVTPLLTEDGKVATFKLQAGSIKLSRMPDGKWGFHL